ncbi:uncharacterized protein LOC121830274 [Peromyscus maniculatus bairdii]|uniref:uncharacterized protein LOC121830274 n=1 Tax=Peromyscus maniculatus bairdii TaxID=230844 RepID=UPI003FD2A2EC
MTPTEAEVRRSRPVAIIASCRGPQERVGLRGEPAWTVSGEPDPPLPTPPPAQQSPRTQEAEAEGSPDLREFKASLVYKDSGGGSRWISGSLNFLLDCLENIKSSHWPGPGNIKTRMNEQACLVSQEKGRNSRPGVEQILLFSRI